MGAVTRHLLVALRFRPACNLYSERLRAAVPSRSLEDIAERWLAMNRRDGVLCPPASDLTVAIRSIHRATTSPSPDRTRSPSPAKAPALGGKH